MSKFGWILGASLRETIRFSKACDAIAGKICHIRWTLEPASQSVVEALNPLAGRQAKRRREAGQAPLFGLLLGLRCGFGAILTLFMSS